MSELAEFRAAKDAFLADDPHSPLTPLQHRTFTGLAYFEERPELALTLRPEPFERPELIAMQTSTGETAIYERWARAHFEVDGAPAALTIYRDPESGALFAPFRDATSGDESYGAGRYVEPEQAPDGNVLLNFNYAYNPYCAYSERWSCPLPPEENRLAVPIRAGERSFPG